MLKDPLAKIIKPLLEWYQINERDLPWRKTKDPYCIWISEIMLQQTRIESAKAYYTRFIKELPTVKGLAEVKEEKLLKLWEGLGYYTRARNLKKAAQEMVLTYHAQVPSKYEQLVTLPGIGPYTAGAIASICFHEKVAAVDGNVLRVLTRVLASTEIVDLIKTKNQFRKRLESILPDEVGDFNQAIMELGELICVPNGMPECLHCPLKEFCSAYEQGIQLELPKKLSKRERKKEEKTIMVFICDKKIAISKRAGTGLLANLYEFPNINNKLSLSELKQYLNEKNITSLGETKHIFTHTEWHMKGYLIEVSIPLSNYIWVSYDEIKKRYPLPTAFRFFKDQLFEKLDKKNTKS